MQKVRSHKKKTPRAAYKTTISYISLTVLFSDAHMLYLAFEVGSPSNQPYVNLYL